MGRDYIQYFAPTGPCSLHDLGLEEGSFDAWLEEQRCMQLETRGTGRVVHTITATALGTAWLVVELVDWVSILCLTEVPREGRLKQYRMSLQMSRSRL